MAARLFAHCLRILLGDTLPFFRAARVA